MRDEIIPIEYDEVAAAAERYFLRTSGIEKREGEKFDRMRRQAYAVREEIASRVQVRAVVSRFDVERPENNRLTLCGSTFFCNAFSRMNREEIQAVYCYVITAGDYSMEGEPMMKQLYADLWGTAYVDAGRDVLEQRILSDHEKKQSEADSGEFTLSNSFGPGFYGMAVEQMADLFRAADGTRIGVRVHSSSILIPVKSCAGLYFAAKKGTLPNLSGCERCAGNRTGCSNCRAKEVWKNEKEEDGRC